MIIDTLSQDGEFSFQA